MDDLEKSIPAAESMVETENSSPKASSNEFCLNCGTKLHNKFCHHCGQKDIPKRQTLGELWTNFISSFWSYEGKFFQTTKYILIRPGFLAIEYNKGKRESYYHPARMYVFISFVFFLLFFSLPDSDGDEESDSMSEADRKELVEDLKEAGIDTLVQDSSLQKIISGAIADSSKSVFKNKAKGKKKKNKGVSFTGPEYKSAREYDSVQSTLPEAERDGWFLQKLNRRASELNERYKNDDQSFGKDFGEAFANNFSKVLFWLLPVFALLLKLLYIRKDYFFSEHLVFSIYYYNFFFLVTSFSMLIQLIPWLDWLGVVIGFWIFFYLLFAMKRMYGQRWGKTILKFSLFVFSFSFMLVVGIAINAMAILFVI